MQIIRNRSEYIDQLTEAIEVYRVFCGFSPSPENTKLFFQALLANNEAVTFLAIDETMNVLMGFANLYPSYSTLALQRLWILNDLGVAKDYRGRGVATALIQQVIAFAKETQAIRIELKTHKTNENAQKLYRSLGFTVDEENIYYRVPV